MNGKTVQMFSSYLSALHILTTVTQIFKSFIAIGKIPGGLLALKWKKNPQCQENVAQSAFKTTTVKYLKVFLYLCRAFCSLSLNLEVLDCLALILFVVVHFGHLTSRSKISLFYTTLSFSI